MYVGLDVHKKTIQVAAVDQEGKLLFNRKIKSDFGSVERELEQHPPDTKYVMESSSVWYGLFRYITDTMKRDVVLSNPYNTKIIATSLKKTDKVDAYQLANLLRGAGGYIAVCYVPDATAVSYRHLTRHRNKLVKTRSKLKNFIHGITLQKSIRIQYGHSFSPQHIWELRNVGDYRINSYLDLINSYDKEIRIADKMIKDIVNGTSDIKMLTTIPGVGPFTALTVYGEIADVSIQNCTQVMWICRNSAICT